MRSFRTCITLAIVLSVLAGCGREDNGYLRVTGQIEATNAAAGSRIGGRVSEVCANEGDTVGAGDLLVRLESREAEAKLEAAQANLTQSEAVLEKLIAGPRPDEIRQVEAALAEAEAAYLMAVQGARSEEIEAARANAAARRAPFEQASADLERAKALRAGGAISQQDLDHAEKQLEVADNQFRAAMEQLDLLLEGTRDEQIAMAKAARDRALAARDLMLEGTREEDIAAARAAKEGAGAQAKIAETNLDEMTVVAPMEGVVESLDIEPGDIVPPGPLVSVVDPERLELTVYVSAKVLGKLRVGEQVDMTTDSHGPETFPAEITFIASEGEFTPRNLQTEEERVQQVFAVKLSFDSAEGKLRAGMSATVRFPLNPTTQ